ncbi:angiotensin-converting enzyme-like [Ixodes scapularis]|uniref:angiotensin-converting enzyme-like n=1 Tax=Ixodes scapularis TaxID=6945 RepID=UPI001A9D1553|nr:angiotensin-converting enzyme-like [Ixodes scapularis]
METSWFLVYCFLVLGSGVECASKAPVEGEILDEERGKMYAKEAEVLLTDMCLKSTEVSWNYGNNLTEHNKNLSIEQSLVSGALYKEVWKNMTQFKWTTFKDEQTRTIFRRFSTLGTSLLPEDKQKEYLKIVADMKGNHAAAKICPFHRMTNQSDECNVPLEPTIKNILQDSRDYDELLHVWNEWRRVSGRPLKAQYSRYVELQNEAAMINGFDDASGMWQESYECEDFEESIDQLWEQLQPLYKELHAYVRARLHALHGDKVREDGPIPAHLLGQIHSQQWNSLYKFTQPYPGKPTVDVTDAMLKMNMTPTEMFKLSEKFFTSMGLPPMPDSFWEKSVLEKPTDREIVCHASAWDFCGSGDVRIKQCTQVKMDDLLVVHHEMGHIEYDLNYAKQPYYFRAGANPGFHEAIGDTISLSVATPKHLKAVGLLEQSPEDTETGINYLYKIALDKVAGIPSMYVYDRWRWNVFKGKYQSEQLNKGWWDLLLMHQGICPGVARTPEDFDPPSKYHISASVPYIRYFASTVLQFQFYKALCEEANHKGPLHECDFYQSKEAGKLFGDILALGSSKPWPEVLGMLTKNRTTKMDAGPLLEYFQPLLEWLRKHNEGKFVGWKSDDSTACPAPPSKAC